jgi:tetratricopeptide (TPR) repeat protein
VNAFSYESNIFLNAQHVVFTEEFKSMGALSTFLDEHHENLTREAQAGNAEALLRLTLLYCSFQENYEQAIQLGDKALKSAIDSKLPLGRFWFALGFAHQGNEDIAAAKKCFLNSIGCGFGHALTNLGDIVLVYDQNLRAAVDYWKTGRDVYNIDDCAQALFDLEIEPGTYSASIQLDDGSIEQIFYNDTQDGFFNRGS